MKLTEKAPVQVVMPEVKLTVADLSYMTGLMAGGTRCHMTANVKDRLTFLGLIEIGEVPPCPKQVAEFDAKEKANRAALKAAVRAGDWDKAIAIATDWGYQRRRRPAALKDYVLTAAGKEFIAKGRATSVTSLKSGCVK